MDIHELYEIFKKHPRITIDSRQVIPGSIFFAIKGENFNGNDFAIEALSKGAAFAVVDESTGLKNGNLLLVRDSLSTLQELANYHRNICHAKILAITGSNGKTTTKELLNAILSTKYKVTATKGNLNNHIGVPLSLLSISKNTNMAIIEMGANHVGEIAKLCEIAQPELGIITNIGKAHLEGFGSFEGVVKAKTELYKYLHKNKGTVFVNSEDQVLLNNLHTFDGSIIQYGRGNKSNCIGELTSATPFVSIKLIRCSAGALKDKKNNIEIHSRLIGDYNLNNIMAAICIGKYFNIENQAIKKAIENYAPMNNRSQYHVSTKNNLILDNYNANPSSMEAAINNFIKMQGDNKMTILGDMLELGKYSNEEHKRVIELLSVNSKHIPKIILVGNEFYHFATQSNILFFKDVSSLIQAIPALDIAACNILIKGSRGIQLEKIIPYL